MTNMYESVVFFAWTIVILYLAIEWKFKTRTIGAFALPLAFLAMVYGSFAPINKGISPLVPALQSNWLLAHVITCFVGYAAFAIAAALAFPDRQVISVNGDGAYGINAMEIDTAVRHGCMAVFIVSGTGGPSPNSVMWPPNGR